VYTRVHKSFPAFFPFRAFFIFISARACLQRGAPGYATLFFGIEIQCAGSLGPICCYPVLRVRHRNSISSPTFFYFFVKKPTGYVTLFFLRISIQVAGSFTYVGRSQVLRVRHRKSKSSSTFSAFSPNFLSHFFVFEFRVKVRDLFSI
jgi:hypothetical protein